MLPAVASSASFRGRRKLRAYPSATVTTCPRFPSLSTSYCKMICIFSVRDPVLISRATSSPEPSLPDPAKKLDLRAEGQQSDVLRPLDGHGEPALVTRAGSRHTARK